jgi:HD-GYP domain-containing protein (c-di-GMP phosphodiesterase class II)
VCLILVKKQVPVGELRLGMYVVELDRPWLDTPFPFQGFPITSADQIAALKSLCKVVFVDPERDEWRPGIHFGLCGEDATVSDSRASREPAATDRPHPNCASAGDRATFEKELPAARLAREQCKAAVRGTFESLTRGRELEAHDLTSAVQCMTDSIQRNPDAMMLLNAVRKKGDYELGRALDTSILMITFARFLQLPREELELLGLAGLLLDLGKTRIPDALLRKKDILSPTEYETMKAHVGYSVDVIRGAKGLPGGLEEIVLLHHERQDGSGYPRGLRGAEITLYGSLAALVDSFSALTSCRVYAEQSSASNALALLHKLRGRLFHEALVEQFIQCIGIYPVGSFVELNTGEVAIVIAQNLVRRLQPRVMIVLDREWLPIHPQKIIDLVAAHKTAGGEVYRIRRTLPKDRLPIDPEEFFV